MKKKIKKISAVYTAIGSGIGLVFGIISSNLALGLIFGGGIGIVIDSIVYSNKRA